MFRITKTCVHDVHPIISGALMAFGFYSQHKLFESIELTNSLNKDSREFYQKKMENIDAKIARSHRGSEFYNKKIEENNKNLDEINESYDKKLDEINEFYDKKIEISTQKLREAMV